MKPRKISAHKAWAEAERERLEVVIRAQDAEIWRLRAALAAICADNNTFCNNAEIHKVASAALRPNVEVRALVPKCDHVCVLQNSC
jgi:hypothetical protein